MSYEMYYCGMESNSDNKTGTANEGEKTTKTANNIGRTIINNHGKTMSDLIDIYHAAIIAAADGEVLPDDIADLVVVANIGNGKIVIDWA